MTPSSDQSSSTPTPIDPDMRLTPTPQSTPTLPATPTMNTHSTTPQDQAQEMVNLKQIWSGVSFERSNDEIVSYVRIQVHPRTVLAWNQVTQTPSLPIRLEPPSQIPSLLPTKCHELMSKCAARYTPTKPLQGIHGPNQLGKGTPKQAPLVWTPWTHCLQPFFSSRI